MDATSFQFTMTMPGDDRLMETVRDLTAHAAKYAQLAEPVAQAIVDQVLAAATVSSRTAGASAVELRFERTPDRFDVAIEWDGRPPAGNHPHRDGDSTSVEWSHDGHRQRCLVSHRARN
jgi:hypothetical protein